MILSTLLLAASVAIAIPATNLILHEKDETSSFSQQDGKRRIDPTAILPMRIALTQTNLESGEAHLMSVSDPDSPSYGQHWSLVDIHSAFAPSEESISAVKAWLWDAAGVRGEDVAETESRQWLGFKLEAAKAEHLLGVEFYEVQDGGGGVRVGAERYHVPAHLSKHIDYISPGIMASAPLAKRRIPRKANANRARGLAKPSEKNKNPHNISATSLTSCGDFMTPACIRALYGIPEARFNQSENVLGVFELVPEIYAQEDLDLFWEHFAPWVPNGTHPRLMSINNATAPASIRNSGGESDTDFDLTISLLYPQSVILYESLASNASQAVWKERLQETNITREAINVDIIDLSVFEPLLQAVDGSLCTERERRSGTDCGAYELTRVLSASWGAPELRMPERALRRACADYMKLALKGHTMVFSSGDTGPGCLTPNAPANHLVHGRVFNPIFPATCPFVTAAGATQLDRNATVGEPERAMYVHAYSDAPLHTFSSSGGRSNYFSTPSYQRDTVDPYFENLNPSYATYNYTGYNSVGENGGKYASAGRAFPDVSANGAHLAMYIEGSFITNGGTSLAAPIWSSIFTLINQERTNAGKGPVGFVNPVLYKHPEAFHDITLGSAPGCETEGFEVKEGWDPITGLGTPKFSELLKIFMALP